ncbi:MAG: septum site-determining protein MinC [Ruminococcaceae bacterium]|nr:septum site-determining protein MinC [Oscillospiraceae bacterium]
MITLKGSKDGITIYIEEAASLEAAREELAQKLGEAKAFFRDAKVVIRLESDCFSAFQLYLLQMEITNILEGASVSFIQSEAESLPKETVQEKEMATEDVWYRGTVRSGQVVTAQGNLVILGDANPGCELRAGGSIVVTGTARGVLCAGIHGDRSAVVSAARLAPSQIRIADVISRRPDGEGEPEGFRPEFAEIREGSICIITK